MAKIFYIGDLHFGHANAIKFDNRGFSSVEQMDKTLINNWNSVVTDEDTVYVLGDMFWYKGDKAVEILEQLKGRKRLIKGNHDRIHDSKFKKHFEKITEYDEIDDNGRKVILCHYPICCFKNHFYGSYHLYAHVHNSFEWDMMTRFKEEMEEIHNRPCKMYNTGCMLPYMRYTPRTLNEILEANGDK